MKFMRVYSMIVPIVSAAAFCATTLLLQPQSIHAAEPRSIAFLGVHFQNDNEIYEPTSDAERNRMAKVEQVFKDQLTETGKYRFAEVGNPLKTRIAAGQAPGECGGCEIDYGKEIGTEQIAWIRVQKVSNLILNLNLYMADVDTKEMVFVRSVDIRNNSDEGWERAITYLLKNYLLPRVSKDLGFLWTSTTPSLDSVDMEIAQPSAGKPLLLTEADFCSTNPQ
jgi:hypothetical protein